MPDIKSSGGSSTAIVSQAASNPGFWASAGNAFSSIGKDSSNTLKSVGNSHSMVLGGFFLFLLIVIIAAIASRGAIRKAKAANIAQHGKDRSFKVDQKTITKNCKKRCRPAKKKDRAACISQCANNYAATGAS